MPVLPKKMYEDFCQLVAAGESYAAAYRRVSGTRSVIGARVGGHRLMKRKDVQQRIREILSGEPAREERVATKEALEELKLTKKDILWELWDTVQMAKGRKPGRSGKNGDLIYTINLPAANKALELIGREFGMFVDVKKILTGPLDDLSAADLKKLEAIIDATLRGEIDISHVIGDGNAPSLPH